MFKVTQKIHDRIRNTIRSLIPRPVSKTDIFLKFNEVRSISIYSEPTMYQIYGTLCLGPTQVNKTNECSHEVNIRLEVLPSSSLILYSSPEREGLSVKGMLM